jgi:hypothetical protein
MAAAFSGCQKEDFMDTVEETKNYSLRTANPKWEWYDNGPEDFGCSSDDVDCFDVVIITGFANKATMNSIISTIIGGNTSAIIQSFTNHRAFLLSEGIDAVDVDGVINSTKTVNMRGTNPNQIRYMRFYVNGSLDIVYPIKNQ